MPRRFFRLQSAGSGQPAGKAYFSDSDDPPHGLPSKHFQHICQEHSKKQEHRYYGVQSLVTYSNQSFHNSLWCAVCNLVTFTSFLFHQFYYINHSDICQWKWELFFVELVHYFIIFIFNKYKFYQLFFLIPLFLSILFPDKTVYCIPKEISHFSKKISGNNCKFFVFYGILLLL